MKPMKFGIGQPVKRVEDARLVTGQGQYTSDIAFAGAATAMFLRSPHAHARFAIDDVGAALAVPGVLAVLTAADVAHLGGVPCLAVLPNADGSTTPAPDIPLLCKDVARHVGDAVAMVVAESEAAARAGLEAIAVAWTPAPASADLASALKPGAAQVWPEAPGNLALDTGLGDKAKTDAAFAGAAKVVRLRLVNNRLIANYMETRAAVGEYDAASGRYTLTVSSQGVHGLRDTLAEKIMKIAPERIRVATRDVGGGFGTKTFMYREYPLVLAAAQKVGRPVRWVADRSEHFIVDAHGRDNVTIAEMALDREGRFLGLRVDILGGLGAYPSQYGPYIHYLGATMATGPYDIGAFHARVRCVYTHTTPVDAYRGAGRPEAAYVLERLVDACAQETGIDPAEIRARNFIKPGQMPFATLTGRTYDVGEFEGAMRQALAKADRAGFEARAKESAAKGRLRGFGFASYIECTAWGEGETGQVSLDKDGGFTVLIGTQSNGQGHETAYAQVVAQYLDVPVERVRVVQGDTDRVASGAGTGGSRSIPVGAAMTARASDKLALQLKELAADKLEAAVADLEIVDGAVRIAGTDRAIDFSAIARLPRATPEALRAVESWTPPEATYPNGTHVCELEVDPETGAVEIARYTICDDFGLTMNPLLLAGQVHGGVVQGLGQAFSERAVYTAEGQLVSASLMDYAVPRAGDAPAFHFETRNVPSTTNPLGLKGAGEAGSIGSCPAAMNALVDALRRGFGVQHLDMPATPAAVHAAIRAARG
ncbi:MAG: xanthine dehydrogenase family protein molybdopterin-binding subunit [Methylobacteriaceae bacterium]|nr:xanthine dehydrogenase family protein molybdopterin-binding subunit [Methylobacteriaceae bacterium]